MINIRTELNKKHFAEMLKTVGDIKNKIGNLIPVWEEWIPTYQKYMKDVENSGGTVMYDKHWEKYSKAYAKKKRTSVNNVNLRVSGKLWTAASGGAGWFENKKDDSLEIGIKKSVVPYAGYIQGGTKKMPARPFFKTAKDGLTLKALENLLKIAKKYLMGQK